MARGDGIRRHGVRPGSASCRLLAAMLGKPDGARVLGPVIEAELGMDSHALSQASRQLVACGILGRDPGIARRRAVIWLIDRAAGEAALELGRMPPCGRERDAIIARAKAERAQAIEDLSVALTGGLVARILDMHRGWAGPRRELLKAGMRAPVDVEAEEVEAW